MVGYKTPRYLYFGRCGARLDDWMNWIPARLTWLLISALASIAPTLSGTKAFRIGWQQHAILPGPNSGWSEAAMAGALERKLIGPIYVNGQLVTSIWLGEPSDPPAATPDDLKRGSALTLATGLTAAALVFIFLRAY